MTLDLETFLTTLYVMTDDLYQEFIQPKLPVTGGPAPKLSDAEVLCLGLAAQWRSGVPWQSERGFVRYAQQHLRPLFPGLLSQSAFNRRLRRLWGAFILIQQAVGQQLSDPQDWEVMDCVPVPIAHGARSFHPGWLADIARIGKGGNDRFFFGLHLLLAVSVEGVITGWTLAAGNVQDRWLAELLLSARAGQPQLTGPRHNSKGERVQPPSDWIGPTVSAGPRRRVPILADLGYYGSEWYQHWLTHYGSEVLTASEQDHRTIGHLFSRWRQVVETAFAHLGDTFGLKYPGAHTTWGLLTRMAAKAAAYNLGLLLNRMLGRPDFAFATLIV